MIKLQALPLLLLPLLASVPLRAIAQVNPSSEVRSVQATIKTGGDDLRGGAVAYGTIRLRNGTTLPKIILNGGRQWRNGSTNTVSLPLPPGTRLADLNSALFTLEQDGAPRNIGETYNNWNVDAVKIATPSTPGRCSGGAQLISRTGRPLVRLTGERTFYTTPFSTPPSVAGTSASALQVRINTGGDDLRGGAVAYGTIRLRNGTTLPKVNLNAGRGWGNNSSRTVTLPLPSETRLSDLATFTLEHDGAPRNVFESYDNWNVDGIRVTTPRVCSPATAGVTLANVSGRPFVRLTGEQTLKNIPLRLP
ncbi:hypothetical protein [Myxacorys almedinensis]|uniref:Uncharacterized protein n=1 Tax=Myxacorys almedinensis A TaxID=2690445 RepID=A0A8J7YYW9_9CYAN|nr:hypothetical protein [Myxacorys almedinensis]NDJ17142.1 hypothetical protein [Myxacorys almedinensis A]